MATVSTKNIRNVCLLGHGGSGKTSLAEAMLFLTQATDRLGSVPAGNTVCDYDAEEIARKISISAAVAPVMWKDVKVNVIDTPGYLDFAGEVVQALRVADSAIIVVDGKAGIEVGTELAWEYAEEAKLPRAFFINKFDDNEARFGKVLDSLHATFGKHICPLTIPMVKNGEVVGAIDLIDQSAHVFDENGRHSVEIIPEESKEAVEKYRDMLMEAVASTSEDLMMKYFDGKEITHMEAVNAVHDGIIHGEIVPVFCGAAAKLWGVWTLLDKITESFPRHTAKKCETTVDGDEIEIVPEGGAPSIFVFKTVADPFVGKMSFFKVMNGTLKRDMALRNTTTGLQEKMAHIYTICGKKQTEVDELACGDIGMTAKLQNTNSGDTLTWSDADLRYRRVVYPRAYMERAIRPTAKGDEDKISGGIAKLLEEDPTLRYENNATTKEMLISGLGDIHLDVVVAKLKARFGTSVTLTEPKIAYRETIKKRVDAEGKHKKQSGGHGQYGHVKIHFGPGEAEGLTFTESTFGGSVPKNFHPAVEKGILECMQSGVLAGFPVVNLAADLYDGSYHDVDSSEMSFKLAAALAYKDGMPRANPVILEPIGSLKVYVPNAMVGDIMGDVNKRRGSVLGVEPMHDKNGYTCVEAEVPRAEMSDYVVSLRAATQGRASFDYEIIRYQEVPANVAQKIIENAKKEEA